MDPMSRGNLASACRWILTGTLVIVLDVSIDGFDLVNDTLGALVVVGGILLLIGVVDAPGNRRRTRWLVVVAGAGVLCSLTDQLGLTAFAGWTQVVGAALLATVLATVLAAESGHEGWSEAARRWQLNRRLVVWLWLIPAALLEVLVRVGLDGSYESPLALPLVIVALAPLVHLIVTLLHTARVADGHVAEAA